MTSVLTPRLTALDAKVLDAVGEGSSRTRQVTERIYGWAGWRCDVCGRARRATQRQPRHHVTSWRCTALVDGKGCGGTERPMVLVADEQLREVAEVLRGLECVGVVVQGRGGWWRRP